MGGQRSFASLAWTQRGKVTRRERFLAEIDGVIPWARLQALVEPHYPKAGNRRQPLGLHPRREAIKARCDLPALWRAQEQVLGLA